MSALSSQSLDWELGFATKEELDQSMEILNHKVSNMLNDTLSSNNNAVRSSTKSLDHLSAFPNFALSLISIATGKKGENLGQRVAAATYLKNFIRRIDRNSSSPKFSKDFKSPLLQSLLQAEPAVLKVLVEAFRIVVVAGFVKENSWPELVPELRSAIKNSNLFKESANSQWKTINALMALHATISPFQYFMNPKVAKEPVPPQLELISNEILVPLLAIFHNFVEKVLSIRGRKEMEIERVLLIVCKCMYFAVRSHMPPAIVPLMPSFCRDLFGILDSLTFDGTSTLDDGYLLRLKTGKRSLLIFCVLVSRHRKYFDRLMPDIINCVSKIVRKSANISKLDVLSERVVSLAFDVISHLLETGPGWRLVSPHFSSLLDSAIFPALVMNDKDTSEWEEDADEYIRKNLPSDLEEISGWREDLFTCRKSAINLLGVISMSKGPPTATSAASSKRKKGDKSRGKEHCFSVGELLVIPFLSKFPIPSDVNPGQTRISNDYYGVLMAYGSLQDFLRERNSGYTEALVRNRVLPVYSLSSSLPYLVATANWLLGEIASCLPQEMSGDIYNSLLKALTMPDVGDISCYPVRVSAAGAISELLENDYLPPEWLPLLQVVVSRTESDDDNESSILFQLLSSVVAAGDENVAIHIPFIVSAMVGTISKHIPPIPEPWPQVVERGFAALAVMAQTWENFVPAEIDHNELGEMERSGWANIARSFSFLLQQAWLPPLQPMEGEVSHVLPSPSCIEDASALLRSIMHSITETNVALELKISELLAVWADLIADWHAWDDLEDISIFNSIREVVNLHRRCELMNFIARGMPHPPAPPVPQRSIIEGIGTFVSEAISQYPSATWRACSCVHLLLHVPSFSFETEGVKQSLVITFSRAAFSQFREIKGVPCAGWKPLLLAISSCYLCYPDIVKRILEKEADKGFTVWASALGYISTSSFEPGLSAESEIKLIVMTLGKVIERLLVGEDPRSELLRGCFVSLMEAAIRLKEVQVEVEDEDDGVDDDGDDVDEETDDDDDEDSEDDERDETEEEFLDRYAKAADALESGMVVEEGDADDQDQELELGLLGEVDQQRTVLSLLERYHKALIQEQALPAQLITGILNTFPEYRPFFPHPL